MDWGGYVRARVDADVLKRGTLACELFLGGGSVEVGYFFRMAYMDVRVARPVEVGSFECEGVGGKDRSLLPSEVAGNSFFVLKDVGGPDA